MNSVEIIKSLQVHNFQKGDVLFVRLSADVPLSQEQGDTLEAYIRHALPLGVGVVVVQGVEGLEVVRSEKEPIDIRHAGSSNLALLYKEYCVNYEQRGEKEYRCVNYSIPTVLDKGRICLAMGNHLCRNSKEPAPVPTPELSDGEPITRI